MRKERLWTPEFLGLCGGNFNMLLSQYMMVAALPIFIIDTLHGSDFEAGMAMTCFQAGTVICRPFAGRIVDNVNKRRFLFALTVLFTVIMAAFYFFQSLLGAYTLRFIHGIVFAVSTTTLGALAALVLPPSCKGEGIGYYALSTNLAMVVGPMIGLILIGIGDSVFFASMSVVGLLTIWLANRKRLPDAIVMPHPRPHRGFSIYDFIEKRALALAGLGGLVFFAYGGVLTLIPLYARELGLQNETSLFFMIFAAIIVVTRPLIGRIFDRLGSDYTVYPGLISFFIGMILLSRISTLTGLLGAALLLGFGFGALSPAFQTLAIQRAPSSRAGVATATYFWSLDINVGLAAILLSLVAEACGYRFMYGIVNSAIIVLTAILYTIWRARRIKAAGRARKARI